MSSVVYDLFNPPPRPQPDFSKAQFNGASYAPKLDDQRLRGQIARVYEAMKDEQWRTLSEIEALTNDPPASISAQLRHLRKERFGGFKIEKRARGKRENGLFE